MIEQRRVTMKKVLILNGSFCEVPIIKKAKELGYYVVTTGNMPNLVGHQYADEYIPADYMPCSRYNIEDMYKELMGYVDSVKEPHLHELLELFFVKNTAFIKSFKKTFILKY